MSAPIPPCTGIDKGTPPRCENERGQPSSLSAEQDLRARLANIIASEIVPRLLLINQQISAEQQIATAFTKAEIAEFGGLAITAAAHDIHDYVRKLQAKGHSLQDLFMNLLAPAAHHLGEMWNEDRCDFLDVTIAIGKLQSLMASFSLNHTIDDISPRNRALLVCTPGEQHVLGLEIVAELMRAAGWDVVVERSGDRDLEAMLIHADWFDVCGVTMSSEQDLPEVARTITLLRGASRNRKLGVMVGGRAFSGRSQLAAQTGADAVVDDAPSSVIVANRLAKGAGR